MTDSHLETRVNFRAARMTAEEWTLIRQLYSETYPVRPLLNEYDALAARVKVLEGLVKGAAGAADRDSYYFPENWEEHAEAYFKGVTA